MFQPISATSIDPHSDWVDIVVDGNTESVPAGITVAAALVYLQNLSFRASAVSGSPRGPYCMMGVCFECLIEIDGDRNQRACQVDVSPGMVVKMGTSQPLPVASQSSSTGGVEV